MADIPADNDDRGEPAADTAPRPVAPAPSPAGEERSRPDPTRYGDWEKNGRCIDF